MTNKRPSEHSKGCVSLTAPLASLPEPRARCVGVALTRATDTGHRWGPGKADKVTLEKTDIALSPPILIYLAFTTGGGEKLKLKRHTQPHSHLSRQRFIYPHDTITHSLLHNHLYKTIHAHDLMQSQPVTSHLHTQSQSHLQSLTYTISTDCT